jgi:hypothetical protein
MQLHCTDTFQLQVLENGTITATTAPLVFVEYNYIVPTLRGPSWSWSYQSQKPAAVRCRYNVVVFYKHEGVVVSVIVPLQKTCSCKVLVQCSCILQTRGVPLWPCRKTPHCTDTLPLQALGNGTITATTAPLVFVENNYIVPTPYRCRLLGMVQSRPRRPPSCL